MVAYNAADPPLPIPPMPVMPPEGVGPVVNPATPAQDAEMSPTAMIQNYLAQRGYQPTSENVRRALEANARDPGVVSGLRSDTAATNAEDLAAMAARRPRQNNTPQNAINTSIAMGDSAPGTTTTTGPAAGGGGGNLGSWILGLLGVPGLARTLGPRPGDPNLQLGMSPRAGAPQVGGPADAAQLAAPAKQLTGPPAAAEAPVANPGEVIRMPGVNPAEVMNPPGSRPDPTMQRGPAADAIDKAVPPEPVKPRVRVKARARAMVR